MSPANQTLLARFAAATSVFALIMVGVVAATSGGSGDGGGGSAAAAVAPVNVSLAEFSITPATITVPEGATLQVSNDGTMIHNLAVLDTDLLTADLPAGGTESLDLSSLAPGTYEVFCTIPGHKDSGMVGTLEIVPEGTEVAAAANPAEATSIDQLPENADGTHDHSAVDLSGLESSSPLAQAISAEMEQGMTEGVNQFLDFATKYAEGEVEAGNQKLEPAEVLADGTKRFEITAAVTDWEVSPGKVVKAWTYNGMVPGPWIQLDQGDKVQVDVTNELPISTDVHWHGLGVPNSMDGVAPITQEFIQPGETFTYEFTAPNENRMAMYHAHHHGQEAILNGLFSVIQVGEMQLPPPGNYGGLEVPADIQISQEIPMVLNDAGVIGLSLNGKAWPETAPIAADKGDWILLHYYNEGLVGHPMHLHSQPHIVIAKDGYPLAAPYRVDTTWISPGERYSVLIKADNVGTWAFHCHIINHAEDDDGLMGMVTAMIVNDPNAA